MTADDSPAVKRNPYFHVRKEDVHQGSAIDRDPPFASFDVVLRRDYDAIVAERDALQVRAGLLVLSKDKAATECVRLRAERDSNEAQMQAENEALVAERDALQERAEQWQAEAAKLLRDLIATQKSQEAVVAERDSARRERDEAHLALCRIHSWLGIAMEQTYRGEISAAGQAYVEQAYDEAAALVELGESKP